ncbi:patatin-like phospholipase family protein [bacterium]|nr:patatin-like phospholipase family protein [Porticoccaceae bacterium]MDB4032673.1 patatin-like phospholipase family protein [Porticoccaceae bacterium]MDB4077341.1 patatin-like phospholipase family protein [Porticoccaceae bacterium]MDB4322042.1 patatin-like phospholipase family protein [bacterium]MDC0003899.1 patatin-like phospholipase family protein [Porticoccaceae bacterium]
MSRGLVLTGGGARAAYQVGVLKGIAAILPRTVYNPFPIICGTSAGAINALSIAGRAGPFRLRTRKLETIWHNLRASDVYRTDAFGVAKNAFHMAASMLHSGYGIGRPISLLDNAPLRKLLNNYVKFDYLETAIGNGELEAIAISAMSYASGQSVTFFQGQDSIQPWNRARRRGEKIDLTIDHLMASTAIPSLFPAVKLAGGYFGDGAVRQLKPISPALHMDARQLLIIGVSDNATHKAPELQPDHSPSIAQIMGHMFNSAFIDAVESDLETLRTINRLASALPQSLKDKNGITDLNAVEVLSISPSQSIDQIAEEHIHELPRSLKLFLKITGATAQGGGTSAASYLLFEPGFCRKLIALGHQDALDQEEAIREFFALPPAAN